MFVIWRNFYLRGIFEFREHIEENLEKEKISREAWINKISSLEILNEMERSLYE